MGPFGSREGSSLDGSSDGRIFESQDSLAGGAGFRAARGCRIGKFLLLSRLGKGRQADVWRALQTKPIAEEVAVKVLHATESEPRRRAQLRREAERGARLASPALLPTYEFGECDGAIYMVMPLVEGCNLADLIAQRKAYFRGKLTPRAHPLATAPTDEYAREIVKLIARVARGAASAHEGRVAHRDIKPGNVLLRRDHHDGVYLCDFGLARDLDVVTQEQLRDGAGSPLYMAPERLLRVQGDEVRGDVYALGVTLFEALLLVPPVEVPAHLPRGLWTTHLTTTTPRRPNALWPGIPSRLETALLRATARNPELRPRTAWALAEELEAVYPASEARRCVDPDSRPKATRRPELARGDP